MDARLRWAGVHNNDKKINKPMRIISPKNSLQSKSENAVQW